MNMTSTQRTSEDRPSVAVIGAGAAGMLFAGACAELSRGRLRLTVYEKNRQPGRKLAITGKGRCNLTNACPPEEFFRHVPGNPRFLYSAVNAFPPSETMALFERLGVPLEVQRGRRVFPKSERAYDVVDALRAYAERGAEVRYSSPVSAVGRTEDGGYFVEAGGRRERFDALVLACGGLSYPLTGSTGDGFRFARALGHTVTPLSPSLVPVEARDRALCASMMGLALKNVVLTVRPDGGGKPLFSEQGEMLFTHFGVSGPLVLSASAAMRGRDVSSLTAEIDLKPALDEKTLDARLLSDLAAQQNRDLKSVLAGLLPAKMTEPFARTAGLDPKKKANAVTRGERARLLACLKRFPLPLARLRPIEEATVTAGGVPVKELDPRTMESRLLPGLYIIGEMIDCDACTGGYNLQIAFSTAQAAARAVAASPGAPDAALLLKGKKGEKKTMKPHILIAIDGPSGAGKSSLAKLVAKKLDLLYIDTGALYRSVGYFMLRRGVDPSDAAAVTALLPELDIRLSAGKDAMRVTVCGEDVGDRIRTPEVSAAASKVSAIPAVRAFLLETQKETARKSSVIMDGRDIGTVILPEAKTKIFLTASPEARAKRRWLQLKEQGVETTVEELIEQQKERDRRDREREVAPAVPAPDAVLLDNSELTLEETAEEVLKLVRQNESLA